MTQKEFKNLFEYYDTKYSKQEIKKTLSRIKNIYENTVSENLKDIKLILKENKVKNTDLIQSYNNILSSASRNVTTKWFSLRKYVRTLFVKEAFSRFYPNKYLKTSLYIDAMVNILDDLLDEELNKQEKTFYILEFGRDLSLYYQQKIEKNIQNNTFHYFNELITLAVAEEYYRSLIKKEKSTKKIIDYTVKSFNLRSLDIDIFIEIAFAENNIKKEKDKEKIKKMGRIFRAINLIKKDITDIEYDTSHNLESIITIINKKNKDNFQKYILSLINYYSKESKAIVNSLDKKRGLVFIVIDNFYKMIKREKEQILKLCKE